MHHQEARLLKRQCSECHALALPSCSVHTQRCGHFLPLVCKMSAVYAPVAVGTPAGGFRDCWERRTVHFHGFEALTTTKGERVKSPEFTSLGHQWHVGIWPGGGRNSDDGMVAVCLRNRSAKSINTVQQCKRDLHNLLLLDQHQRLGRQRSCEL